MDARKEQAIVFEHVTLPPYWRPPLAEPHGAGFFFAQRTRLPASALAARFQIMLPFGVPPAPGAQVVMEALRLDADPPQFAARRVWAADMPGFAEQEADRLMRDFALATETEVEVRSWASTAAGAHRLRAVKVQHAEGRLTVR